MGFKLPAVFDASTSSGVPLFGPSTSAIPSEFTEIPYETFSKSDRGLAYPRPADWFTSDPAYTTSSTSAAGGSKSAIRGLRTNLYETAGADDEGSFSLVDKSSVSGYRGGRGGGSSGPSLGGSRGGRGGYNAAGRGGRGGASDRGGRGGYNNGGGRGGAAGGGYYGGRGRGGTQILGRGGGGYGRGGRWNDQHQRSRSATVAVRSDWQILEEIEFSRLAKLRLEVDTEEPDDVAQYGFLSEYDRSYDRVNTKNTLPLQVIDRVHYNPTTSDDPVIQEVRYFFASFAPFVTPLTVSYCFRFQFASKNRAKIFATDNILSLLMCATRSVYPWDIVIVREGDKLFFDKRDTEEGPFGKLLSIVFA